MSKPVKNLLAYFTSKNATPSISTREPLPTADTEQFFQDPLPAPDTEQPQDPLSPHDTEQPPLKVPKVGDHRDGNNNTAITSRDLMNCSKHVSRALNVQDEDTKMKNRLRLRTSIEAVMWLALQGCAFGCHNESVESLNRGNFIELIKHLAKLNESVDAVVLENAPHNATYTSPDIQKEILHILCDHVRRRIREEVGDNKFCILVGEAQDASNSEQMTIVLRFVDNKGFLKERFIGIVDVSDTSASILKREISNVLAHHNLLIDDLRGQGYDGESNMRGAWKGLQALFENECPYAYYVHCFAHQLQLSLNAASKDVKHVCLFFSMLNVIVALITASPQRQSELTAAQVILITNT